MAALLVFLVVLLSFVFLGFVVTPWTYQLGASWIGLKRPSFITALITSFIAGLLTAVVSAALGWVPLIGGLLSVAALLAVPAFVLQIALDTTFVRGLIIEVVSMVVCSVIGGLIFALLVAFGATVGVFHDILTALGVG